MIDGSNCTHEAVFPLFPHQNIVFAAASDSLALLHPVHRETTTDNLSKRVNLTTSSVD
jgi:hypothetical protein